MMPLVLYFADYPASLLANVIRSGLHGDFGTEGRLVVDGVAYLLIGSSWYYLLGLILRAATKRVVASGGTP